MNFFFFLFFYWSEFDSEQIKVKNFENLLQEIINIWNAVIFWFNNVTYIFWKGFLNIGTSS